MKKTLITLFAISGIAILSSCSKEDDATPNNNTGGAGFSWTDNTGKTTTGDSAYYVEQYKTIKAFKGGMANFIEINLTAGAAGTYTVGPNTNNAISYLAGNDLYVADNGSVVIASNASGKMTGTFNSNGSGASITSLSGKFTDMEVR